MAIKRWRKGGEDGGERGMEESSLQKNILFFLMGGKVQSCWGLLTNVPLEASACISKPRNANAKLSVVLAQTRPERACRDDACVCPSITSKASLLQVPKLPPFPAHFGALC